MKAVVLGVGVLVVLSIADGGCQQKASSSGKLTGSVGGGGAAGSTGPGGRSGDAGQSSPLGTVPDAGGSPRTCSDLFDQSVVSAYAIDISPDAWTKLDADFHDIKDVLAGNPPQTYYPIVFHYGSETVSNAAVRLRGKSSWVDTVMYDANPKMQLDVSFDQIDTAQKFHGVSTIHLTMPRDDWTFLNDRVGNNWLRQIGLAAPCSNSATLNVNGAYYGLYIAEGSVGTALLKQFFPENASGDLFKGGAQAETNSASANWARLQQLRNATDIATLQGLVDLPNTVLEWAAEVVVNDADGYYGGSHNYYIYDQGQPGYLWLPDHTDSALEWLEVFSSMSYREHPLYWWTGRFAPDAPGADYLIVINDPGWKGRYVDAIATQVAKWDPNEIAGWVDAWSAQIKDAMTADPHKWATPDQFNAALAALRDVIQNRPRYLQSFVGCERGNPADAADEDGDGVAWCNDCDDTSPTVHPGAAEICGNHLDDNCNGVVDENCPGEAPGYPGELDAGTSVTGTGNVDAGTAD
jgi:CotH kinase protein/Putative metal-binding motif